MPKTQLFSFYEHYTRLTDRLKSEVTIFTVEGNRLSVNALWDTGASTSAISRDVARKLQLIPIGQVPIFTANGPLRVDFGIISFELPNGVAVRDSRVIICDIANDMLLGMNIIALGDFLISNANNQTIFSFTMPPFPR